MPTAQTNTVARTEVVVAGRKYDRPAAAAHATTLIKNGASVPKDLAVFLREDKETKKLLVTARAERKQHLINHGFTMITEAQSRGFKVVSASASKIAKKSGDESFSVRLMKPGKDGKVSVVDIKTKLSAMSKSDRQSILAELAKLQSDAELTADEVTEVESTPVVETPTEGVQSATSAE